MQPVLHIRVFFCVRTSHVDVFMYAMLLLVYAFCLGSGGIMRHTRRRLFT